MGQHLFTYVFVSMQKQLNYHGIILSWYFLNCSELTYVFQEEQRLESAQTLVADAKIISNK